MVINDNAAFCQYIKIKIDIDSETKQTKTEKESTESDQRLRKELREKSKLLEEKLKLLRTKEVEFRRVTLSKDKAAKEVSKWTYRPLIPYTVSTFTLKSSYLQLQLFEFFRTILPFTSFPSTLHSLLYYYHPSFLVHLTLIVFLSYTLLTSHFLSH